MSFALNNHTVHAFVTKVFREEKDAERELGFWNTVYPSGGRPLFNYPAVLKRANFYCLLVPYFRPLAESERRDRSVHRKVYDCLERFFWRKGCAHNDVRWCNMGWLDADTLVLFDLFGCTQHASPADAREAEFKGDSDLNLLALSKSN
jgi:hypothetical protein